jgi:hypothetical protein
MDDDPAIRKTLGPHLRQDDLSALRPGVGDGAVIAATSHLEVVHANPLRVHPSGGDIDDTGRWFHLVDEKLRQQEVAEEVGGEGRFKPLVGLTSLWEQDPRVVDQKMKRRLDSLRQCANVPHQAQVRGLDSKIAVAGLTNE